METENLFTQFSRLRSEKKQAMEAEGYSKKAIQEALSILHPFAEKHGQGVSHDMSMEDPAWPYTTPDALSADTTPKKFQSSEE